ncbi:FAD binding domain-containing protein [Streptomyces sp. NPDC055105]|uniref:FAD binding domain-containing protein n=1 Tax=Streptomyces sp. NPDC055105 TaxID=3365719 RepID=UPI0037D0178D
MTTQSSLWQAHGDRVQPTSFEYQRADSWDEAVELMQIWQGEAKIIAGGQSLVPMMNLRLTLPAALIDVNGIGDQGGPRIEGSAEAPVLVIPALTRHATVLTSPVVVQHAPLLQHAVRLVGNVRVRHRGTIGGSVAHADPTGEIPCSVLALGGVVRMQSPRGVRDVPITEFFRTYLTTAAEDDEVVTEIRIPSSVGEPWAFDEVTRRFSDFATVAVAVQARAGRPTVVLGGVADRPLRVADDLVGNVDVRDEAGLDSAAGAVADSVNPEGDVHASADYRRRLVRVLVRRALTSALAPQDTKGAGA